MRSGFALAELLIYVAVAAVAMGILVPLWDAFHRAAYSTSQALEDLDGAGRFLEDFRADVRRARRADVDDDTVALAFEDGTEVLYRSGGPEAGVLRYEGEELRTWSAAFESVRFDLRGRLLTVDLELRRHPGGSLRPRLRADMLLRNAEGVR